MEGQFREKSWWIFVNELWLIRQITKKKDSDEFEDEEEGRDRMQGDWD